MSTDNDPGVVRRLVGEVEGRWISVVLESGEHEVGSLESCAICLPARTVSRRHALLRVTENRVSVQDLGSRNGTWVEGMRIDRAAVQIGDRVAFGTALLRLEEVLREETSLAVDTGPTTIPAALPGAADDVTEGLIGGALPQQTRELLRDLVSALFEPEVADIGGALHRLGRATRAQAVGWFTIAEDNGPRVLLAASGHAALLERVLGEQRRHEPVRLRSSVEALRGTLAMVEGDPPAVVATLPPGASVPQQLVLCGPGVTSPGGDLLLLALQMLAAARRPNATDSRHRGSGSEVRLDFPPDHVVGVSEAMAMVYRELSAAARSRSPVLVTGETGVGKEHVVQILHRSSDRSAAPLVVVNCAAIPTDLLEAELFGIEAGVATGVQRRVGKIVQADRGTLFFDEIGDMGHALQAKLLRALQDGEIHPVGASRPLKVDVRVVAATNADLERAVANGRFRRDLYYRLAGHHLHVPPLRFRPDDIPPLVQHFVTHFAAELGRPLSGVSLAALTALQHAPWPGNVRELEHELRRTVATATGSVIERRDLSPGVTAAAATPTEEAPVADDLDLKRHVDALERALVQRAIDVANGNLAEASRRLGLSRNGLVMKMQRLGVGR